MTFYESNPDVQPTGAEVDEFVDAAEAEDETPETQRRPSDDPEDPPRSDDGNTEDP